MIDFNIIDTLLFDWLVQFSSISVVWQESNGPKPDLPYLTLRRQSVSSIAHEYMSNPDDNGIAVISGNRELIINIQAYGSNAFGRLEDLISLHLVTESQELLATEGLSLINQLGIQNITGLNDTLFEERASVDLLLRFASQRENVDVGLIETVEIEGNVKEPDKTFNFSVDLT